MGPISEPLPRLTHDGMTIEELRAWLGIEKGEYKQTFHVRSSIIERAKEELDQVADVSFRYDAVMEGKRIIGWDFVPVPNKPRAKALPANRRSLRRQQKETENKLKDDEAQHSVYLEELKRIDARWLAADGSERQSWLESMSEGSRMFAPKPGARPSRVFLTALKGILEPSLPGL
jgi:plasmid replication initiation protein